MKTYGTVDDKLTGASLGKRHKNFNSLLKSKLKDGDTGDMLSPKCLEDWRSKSQADRIFLTKLANETNNVSAISQILESDNEIDIAIALKAVWMFEGRSNMNDIDTSDYFIKQIFPRVSYHTICRVISTLSTRLKNEALAKDLYCEILPRYGHNLAVKLLPKCPLEFIRSQLLSDNYQVPVLRLKYIYERDPTLVTKYLENVLNSVGKEKMCMSYFNPYDYKPLWIRIAHDDPERFLANYKEHKAKLAGVSLGRRTTLKIIALRLESILKDPEYYLPLLHLPTLLAELKGEHFDRFIMTYMAEEEKNFNYRAISKYLENMKMPFKIEYLFKIYALKYSGASLLSNGRLHDWDLAKELPKEKMNQWGLLQLQYRVEAITQKSEFEQDFRKATRLSEMDCLTYCPTDVAIPRYRTLLKSSSEINSRLNVLSYMLECCSKNDDHVALLSVTKFVASRFRNDLFSLRSGFLDKLHNNFKLHRLSAEHWEPINEMLEFMCLMDEIKRNYWLRDYLQILEEYLRFRLDNGLEIDTVLDIILPILETISYGGESINFLVGVPKHEFTVLNNILERYKKIIIDNADPTKTLRLIDTILLSYSSRSDHDSRCFTECDWLMEGIRTVLKDDKLNLGTIKRYLIENLGTRMEFADELLETSPTIKLVNNYFMHDSDIVLRNIDRLVELGTKGYRIAQYRKLFRKMRTYCSNQFREPLQEQFEKVYKDKPGMLTVALSLILGPRECEDLYKKYFPKDAKVNLTVNAQEYKESEVVIRSIKHNLPLVSSDTLWHFVQGDYLKFALPSVLSSVFFKPMQESHALITQLIDKPVSVKKHGIRLAYYLYPRDQLMPLYVSIWKKEPNETIREVIFQRTFKLLVMELDANRRNEIWEIIKSFMRSFTDMDGNLFNYTGKVREISPELISEYCKTCWEILRMLRAQGVDVCSNINTLTGSFVNCINYFTREFCDYIIGEYLNSFDAGTPDSNLVNFTIHYLVNAETSELQKQHLVRVCKLFEKLINEKWDLRKDEETTFKYRQVVTAFVHACVTQTYERNLPVDPTDLLKSIVDLLGRCLPFDAAFDLNILLKLTIIYREYVASYESLPRDIFFKFDERSSRFFNDLGQCVAQYFGEISKDYGDKIHSIFMSPFNKFMSKVLTTNGEVRRNMFILTFINGLLSSETSTALSYYVAIDLLPRKETINDLFDGIVNKIKSQDDRAVILYLNNKITMRSDEFKN